MINNNIRLYKINVIKSNYSLIFYTYILFVLCWILSESYNKRTKKKFRILSPFKSENNNKALKYVWQYN